MTGAIHRGPPRWMGKASSTLRPPNAHARINANLIVGWITPEAYPPSEGVAHAASPATAPVLRRQPHPARPFVRGEGRRSHLPARAQRRRQNHPAQVPDGPDSGQGRRGELGGQADHRLQAAPARARRHRLRAAGARDLRSPDRRGKPADGPVPLQRQGSQGSTRVHLRAVPGFEGNEAPPRRRPLRRSATAAGHRPRAGEQAAPADPRRTH